MRRMIIVVLALLALGMAARAEGLEVTDTLFLPAGMERIEDSAFEGDTSIQSVSMVAGVSSIGARAFAGCSALENIDIPNSVESIGAQAFENCAALYRLYIPESVESIGLNAFSGTQPDMLIVTEPDSAAMTYAERYNRDYDARTTYRALVIGQTYERFYSVSNEVLIGGRQDAALMVEMLEHFDNTPYDCAVRHDLTAQEMLDAIDQCFGDAQAQDVSLFYYSGHGTQSGALVGADDVSISPDDLRAALDNIPGRKLVIVDACYSGRLIADKAPGALRSAQPEPEAFVDAFMAAFAPVGVAKGLASDGYYVMTASSSTEMSIQWVLDDGTGYSAFTEHLHDGCKNGGADQNKNGVITFDEAFQYTYYALLNDRGIFRRMHAQVYPEGCDWFGFLRR